MFPNNESTQVLSCPISPPATKHLGYFLTSQTGPVRHPGRQKQVSFCFFFCSAHSFLAHDHIYHMVISHGHTTWHATWSYHMVIARMSFTNPSCHVYLTINMPCNFVESFRQVVHSYIPGITLHTLVMLCLDWSLVRF